jgi:acetyl-CoA C-acetyltransferase
MQTNFSAATAIAAGQLDLVISAGVEMMSQVPMGSNGGDLSDKLLGAGRSCRRDLGRGARRRMGFLARGLDAFSLESHRRAARRRMRDASTPRSCQST